MAIDINIESQVSQTITDGVTDKAPSENAVFDALALKIGGAVSIGQVAFGTATGVIGGDAGLFWDNVNKRLLATALNSSALFSTGGALSMYGGFTNRGRIDLYSGTTGAAIDFYAGGTQRMRLDSSGTLVIGATTAGARLDVRAQGALSTDIAFRVRNSTDTLDLLSVKGNGTINAGNLPTSPVGLVTGDIWNNLGILTIV
jgi:hypothetical protein